MRRLRKAFAFLFRTAKTCLSAVLVAITVFLCGYFLGWKAETVVRGAVNPIKVPAADPAHTTAVAPAGSAQSGSEAPSAEKVRMKLALLARQLIGGRDHRRSQTRVIADIAKMDSEEVRAALAELEQAPSTQVPLELRLHLLRRWATVQPRAAWDYARSAVPHSAEVPGWGTMASALLQRWSLRDPFGALQAWAELNPEERDDDRNRWALRQIFSAMGAQDLERALARADTLESSEKTEALRGLAVFAGNEQHRDALLASFAALPESDLRSRVLGEALSQWAKNQPAEAIQWLDEGKFSRIEQDRLEQAIGTEWLIKDPATTAAWLVSRADSPAERSRRLEMIVSHWAHADPDACGQWLNDQALDKSAAGAMRLFANTIAANFPEEAVAWARSIADETARQKAFAQLRLKLRERHPRRVDELLKDADPAR